MAIGNKNNKYIFLCNISFLSIICNIKITIPIILFINEYIINKTPIIFPI